MATNNNEKRKRFLAKKQQEMDKLRRIIDLLDELQEMTVDLTEKKIVEIAPAVTVKVSEVQRLLSKQKTTPQQRELHKQVIELFEPFRKIHQIEQEMRREVRRLVKIEVGRQIRLIESIATPDIMCVRCGKKPRRINDFCKRCARDEGIVVHGKI